MDDAEFERLRREICRTYGSSPHKRKYWLALLDMHVDLEEKRQAAESRPPAAPPPRGTRRASRNPRSDA